ncbi:hypothetical protein GWK10_17115 [Spongiivirga citrea]|uniref:Uncharacterized protein n=1 Tax=Spongiivirga citrea TaxID=1481457 RepID=A0A6M0CLX4_9FLAO|nr:hypothetical protein [Spongiivirga citrea]
MKKLTASPTLLGASERNKGSRKTITKIIFKIINKINGLKTSVFPFENRKLIMEYTIKTDIVWNI